MALFVVSATSGLVAAVLFWRWLNRCVAEPARRTAFAVLFLSPYAFFLYGALYADALFLALAVGAFLCVEARRPVLAGVVGALAEATRPVGVCLVVGLMVLELERSGALMRVLPGRGAHRLRVRWTFDRSRLGWRSAGPLIAVLGVAGFGVFLGIRFGAPFAWFTNEARFHPSPQNWRHSELFAVLGAWADRGWSDPRYPVSALVQAAMVIAVLCVSPFVGRRFGLGYGLYAALLAAVPLWGVGDFFGSGRYVLMAFPAFALFGEWLSRRPLISTLVLGASALTLVLLTVGFGHRMYLS